MTRRYGIVSVIGAPNAGKSTLVNAFVGGKVSIVSPKVQTTRARVLGIALHEDTQIVFVDTPGIFKPKKRLDRSMVRAAWQGAEDTDILLLVIDVGKGRINDEARSIIQALQKKERKAILALNKVDRIQKEKLLKLAQEMQDTGIFTDIYMISALTGSGVGKLLADLASRLPDGAWVFDEDQMSDMPVRLLAAEITREKIFLQLGDELPYSATVETEEWEDFDNGDVRIGQVVYIQRNSQKAIVLGKNGSRIKKIGAAARTELEEILERRVHLNIFIKVRENWMDDPERYRPWGLDF